MLSRELFSRTLSEIQPGTDINEEANQIIRIFMRYRVPRRIKQDIYHNSILNRELLLRKRAQFIVNTLEEMSFPNNIADTINLAVSLMLEVQQIDPYTSHMLSIKINEFINEKIRGLGPVSPRTRGHLIQLESIFLNKSGLPNSMNFFYVNPNPEFAEIIENIRNNTNLNSIQPEGRIIEQFPPFHRTRYMLPNSLPDLQEPIQREENTNPHLQQSEPINLVDGRIPRNTIGEAINLHESEMRFRRRGTPIINTVDTETTSLREWEEEINNLQRLQFNANDPNRVEGTIKHLLNEKDKKEIAEEYFKELTKEAQRNNTLKNENQKEQYMEFIKQFEVWSSSDGPIHVSDMGIQHIKNTMNIIPNRFSKEIVKIWLNIFEKELKRRGKTEKFETCKKCGQIILE